MMNEVFILNAIFLRERKELRFLEPVEEDGWRHGGKGNEHVPPRLLAQRLHSEPPLVPRFGLDRPVL